MTEGIRSYTNARFAEFLPQFQSGELDGTAFRAKVMEGVVEKFTISVASAATHYNHALKTQRIADPSSVKNLGRPEGKKGGRPLQHPVTVIKARSGEVVVVGVSRGKANDLIITAERKGKAKLVIKEDVEAKAAAEAAAATAPAVAPATETVEATA